MKRSVPWLAIVAVIPLNAGELAANKDDTELPVANQIITSPDGNGEIRLLPIGNLRANDEVFTEHRALLFTSGSLVPYVGYASEMGNLSNLGAWSGSSHFAVVFTGEHKSQEMAVVYPKDAGLKGAPVDLAPLLEYGRKHLPWDERALDHDAILEVIPGEGDSVVCLYWRTSSGKTLAVAVTVKMKDRGKPEELAFEFGEPREQVRKDGEPLPTLAGFGYK